MSSANICSTKQLTSFLRKQLLYCNGRHLISIWDIFFVYPQSYNLHDVPVIYIRSKDVVEPTFCRYPRKQQWTYFLRALSLLHNFGQMVFIWSTLLFICRGMICVQCQWMKFIAFGKRSRIVSGCMEMSIKFIVLTIHSSVVVVALFCKYLGQRNWDFLS